MTVDELKAALEREAPAGEVFIGTITIHTEAGKQVVPALLTARRLSGTLHLVFHGPVDE